MNHVLRSVVLLLIIIYIDGLRGTAKARLSSCEIMARLVVFACMIAVLFCSDRCAWEVFGFTLIAMNLIFRARLPLQGTLNGGGSSKNASKGLASVGLSFSALLLGGMLAFRMAKDWPCCRDSTHSQTGDLGTDTSSQIVAAYVEDALKAWSENMNVKVTALHLDEKGEVRRCSVKGKDGTSWDMNVRVVGDKVYLDDCRAK